MYTSGEEELDKDPSPDSSVVEDVSWLHRDGTECGISGYMSYLLTSLRENSSFVHGYRQIESRIYRQNL